MGLSEWYTMCCSTPAVEVDDRVEIRLPSASYSDINTVTKQLLDR